MFAATLVTFLAIGAVLPILPRYVKGPLDGGDVAVGLAIGSFAFTAMVGRPIGGRIADRRSRKLVVVAGMSLCAAAGALYLVPWGLAGLLVARLVLGLGDGWVYTAAAAWVVDLAPPDRRGQVIGIFGMSIWGGLALGPAFGELLLEVSGYDAVWIFAALAPLAAIAIVSRVPRSAGGPSTTSAAPHPPPGASGVRAWIPRGVVGPGTALTLGALGFATFSSFVVLHLEREGVDGAGVAYVAFAASVVLGRLLLGGIPDRRGPRRGVVLAGSCEAIGLTIVSLSSSLSVALVGALVMGLGVALLLPSLALLAIDATAPEQRGVVLGVFTSFFDIGMGVGGPLAGAIASVSGYEEAFLAAAAAAAASAALGAWLATRAGRHVPTGEPPLPEPV